MGYPSGHASYGFICLCDSRNDTIMKNNKTDQLVGVTVPFSPSANPMMRTHDILSGCDYSQLGLAFHNHLRDNRDMWLISSSFRMFTHEPDYT